MSVIQIKDKRFKTFIPEEKILQEVARVAEGLQSFVLECVEWLIHVYGRFDETPGDSL